MTATDTIEGSETEGETLLLRLTPSSDLEKNAEESAKGDPAFEIPEKPVNANDPEKQDENETLTGTVPVTRPTWKRFIGMGFAIICSINFALSLTVVKILHGSGYNIFSIGFWRFQGLIYPSILILAYEIFHSKQTPCDTLCPLYDKDKLKMFGVLLVRCLIGSGAMLFLYASAAYIGAPEASSICMSSPILTTILAWLFLKEACGIIPALATAMNIFGLFVISRPSWIFGAEMDRTMLIGILFGLASLVGNTVVVLCLRVLRKTTFSVIGLGFGITGSITTFISITYQGNMLELPLNPWDAFLFASVAITAFFGQVFFTLSLRFEEAGAISLLRCADIIFGYFWQAILLHKEPDLISVTGTVIIVTGVMLIGARKLVSGLKEDDPSRKRFRCLLM